MKKIYFIFWFLISLSPILLQAGTIHSVSGTVTYEAGGSPAAITFSAYITTRTDDILTESSAGCGYDDGSYYVQCGNFTTPWTAGDTLYIEIDDGAGGIAYGRVVLTYNPNDLLNLIIYPPNIYITPESKDFGSVLTGSEISQTFILSNNGVSPLSVSSVSISGSSDFSIISGGGVFTLSEGQSQNIILKFKPTSIGAISGNLAVISNDPDQGTLNVALSGTGVGHPDIAVSTQNIDFGSVHLNDSDSQTFQIISEGSADLSVSQVQILNDTNGQFAITSGGGAFTLTPGSHRNVTVEYTPTISGIQQATLEIQSNDADENPLQFSIEGTGIVQDISVTPPSYNFGDVVIRENETQVFTITNDGTADLVISQLNISGSHKASFLLGSPFSQTTLAPGQTYPFDIVFEPNVLGSKTAALEIVSDDPDENPFTVSLSGICVVPDIAVTPSSKNFGFITLGSYVTQIFTLQNEGDSPLHIDEISIQGSHSTEFIIIQGSAPKTLAPSNTYNVTVRFEPSSIGAKSAFLRIGSDDPDEDPFDIPLSGNDEAPDIQADKSMLDFGEVILGSPLSGTIIFSNAGKIDLEISQISITGTHANAFQIISGADAVTLSEGESQIVNIQFDPVSVGVKTASVHIESNDPDENPLNIPLTGNGTITDEDPPYLDDVYPLPYSYGIPTNATFQFKVRDDIYGPDLQSLNVTVDDYVVVLNGQDQTGGQVQIFKKENSIYFKYSPLTRLAANGLIMVRVRCRDLSQSTNFLDQSYQLHIGQTYMIYISNQILTDDSLLFEEPSTGFELKLGQNAVSDTCDITFGFINQWPPLPDSVDAVGKTFVFDPYGFTFNKPVSVRMPYDQNLLDAAGMTLSELSLWMFRPLNNQWQNIPITIRGSDKVSASVDRLSYFILGKTSTSSVYVDDMQAEIPEQFALSQNYPNPFNHQTNFTYVLAELSSVKLEIYDTMGRLVVQYELGLQSPGEYQFNWEGVDASGSILPSGIYLVKFQAEKFVQLRKMLLVR